MVGLRSTCINKKDRKHFKLMEGGNQALLCDVHFLAVLRVVVFSDTTYNVQYYRMIRICFGDYALCEYT